jgi:hypothetical protein
MTALHSRLVFRRFFSVFCAAIVAAQWPASSAFAQTDLAQGRPIVASSVSSSHVAQNAVDGSTSTRWSSQYADNQWIHVDLGQTYNITRVVIHWEAAYASVYRIQVSDNASTWTDITGNLTGQNGIVDHANLSGTGRYVRINCIQRATSWGFSIWELDVYGEGGSGTEALLSPGDAVIGGQKVGSNFVQGATGSGSGNVWPSSQGPAKAIDGLVQSNKYLNFAKTNTGFVVTPSVGATVVTALHLYVADDNETRDPSSYELYGTNGTPAGGTMPLSGFTLIASGTLSLPSTRNNDAGETYGQSVSINNSNAYTSYLIVFPTIKNASSANSMQIGDVQLEGYLVPTEDQPLLAPGDPIVGGQRQGANFVQGTTGSGSGNVWPANEGPAKAIDGLLLGSKFLHFGKTQTGFAVTPGVGPSVATALSLWVGNDNVSRDPASYELYGTNLPITGGSMAMSQFTLISSGTLSLPSSRNDGAGDNFGQTLALENSTPYSSYLLIFPTIKNASSANSMQIGEVQIEGYPVSTVTDTDGDQMPDWWEISYGLNPNDPADAGQDPDGDGLTNLQEYLAGTNPTVPNSSGGGVTLQAITASAYELDVLPGKVRVSRDNGAGALTVSLTTSGGAAASDYILKDPLGNVLTNSVTMGAGVTSVDITVLAVADGLHEYPEQLTLTVAPGTGYAVGSPASATVTLYDAQDIPANEQLFVAYLTPAPGVTSSASGW